MKDSFNDRQTMPMESMYISMQKDQIGLNQRKEDLSMNKEDENTIR